VPYQEYESFSSPENVIIIHYSNWSGLVPYALALPERKILVYHNVTPAEYFEPYDASPADWPSWATCRPSEWLRHCRALLPAFAGKVDLAFGDSSQNRDELLKLGIRPAGVLPILVDWERFGVPVDRNIVESCSAGSPTILFVGRIAPNKCQHDLVRMMECYTQVLGRDGRLVLVGDDASLPAYTRHVRDLSRVMPAGRVILTGKISNEELTAYYKTASVFVCMSEHEGFCVPLLEAMRNDVPVVAYAAGAIAETMGGAGVLLHTKEPLRVARVVDALMRERPFRAKVLKTQRERVKHLGHADAETWLEAALTTLFALEGRDGI
jgi:glycosyltransferase involved in cell wall biosynthesis